MRSEDSIRLGDIESARKGIRSAQAASVYTLTDSTSHALAARLSHLREIARRGASQRMLIRRRVAAEAVVLNLGTPSGVGSGLVQHASPPIWVARRERHDGVGPQRIRRNRSAAPGQRIRDTRVAQRTRFCRQEVGRLRRERPNAEKCETADERDSGRAPMRARALPRQTALRR